MQTLYNFVPCLKAIQSFDCSQLNRPYIDKLCLKYGWNDGGHEWLGVYRMSEDLFLFVPYEDDGSLRYPPRIPILWWEDWYPDPELYETEKEYHQAWKENYDHPFHQAKDKIRPILGSPVSDSETPSKEDFGETDWLIPGSKYTLWTLENGLLGLHQATIDPQFGTEINLTLYPFKDEQPIFEIPFLG